MIDDFARPKPRKKPKPVAATSEQTEKLLPDHTINEEAGFKTPEQVAAEKPVDDVIVIADSEEPQKTHWWKKIKWPASKRGRIIASAAIVLVVALLGTGTWLLTHHKTTPVVGKIAIPAKKGVPPKVIYSTLTGLPITDASINQRPVTGVMIENSEDARPQSGLSQAGVVFEAVAEGGVTRFLALFQDQQPTNVGPIRSARPYYVQWDLGFDAAYAHVGGSDDALADIKTWGVKDMNQFYNGDYYHRITTRDAPHNVYTGIDTLAQLESSKGYTSTYTGFVRKKEQPFKAAAAPVSGSVKSATPTTTDPRTPANSIDFSLSGYTYDPHYDYSAATNSYNRSEEGTAQTDANTNAQLSPKVVIAIVVPESQGALDSSGAYYSDYNVIGSGQAYVFQDGTVTTGTWSKASNTDQITFTDPSGKALALNPGQTWISAVTANSAVSYK